MGVIQKILPFIIILSGTYFLSGTDIFQEFMPRSVCMYKDQKLIHLHLVSDAIIFLAYVVIGSMLFLLYRILDAKGFPFSDMAWRFGGFILFCGLTHMMGVLNLYKTYYWIDGIVKLGTGWFSILTMWELIHAYPSMKNLKTPAEFKELSEKLTDVLKEIKKDADT